MSALGGGIGAGIGAGIGTVLLPGPGTWIGGMLGGMFGGGAKKDHHDQDRDEIAPYLSQLQAGATGKRKQAGDLSGMGSEALTPALNYLKTLMGNDPQGVMAATAPERGRVMDQYDTARKSIGQFGPRGGGTTSALAESRVSEAGALADVTSTARKDAFGQAASIGSTLTGLGLSADQLASADLNSIISALLTQEGYDVQSHAGNMQALGGLGSGLGSLLGLLLTRGA